MESADPASPGRARTARRVASAFFVAAAVLSTAIVGRWLAFSGHAASDDEGYILWSLRLFCEGKPLYDEVFSQYGPLLHLGYRALHALTGLLPDHEFGRWTTLAHWLAAGGASGWIAWRLTRSIAVGAAGGILAFASLLPITVEPAHPGGPLVFLVALATALGLDAIDKGRERRLALVVALAGAAMCLIKINVGGFFLLSGLGWLALHERKLATVSGRGKAAALSLGALLIFLWITRTHLAENWVRIYGLVFVGGVASLAFFLGEIGAVRATRQAWLEGILAGGGLALAVALAAVAHGTSPAELLRGALLAPLRHAQVYSHAVPWRPGAALAALALPAGALMLHFFATDGLRRRALITLKLLGGLCFLWHVRHAADWTGLYRFNFEFGPALALIMCLPIDRERDARRSRLAAWVAWVFVWQILQAYPVAGSQVAWSSFLFAPLAAAGIHDACLRLPSPAGRLLAHALPPAGALLALALLGRLGQADHAGGAPLALPGAESLRLPADEAAVRRCVARNLAARGGLVYSLPGMFSFNLWSGRPTPDGQNVTHWFSLLDEGRQTEIARRLAADPAALLVVDPGHLDLLSSQGRSPAGPLREMLRREFAPFLKVGRYEVHALRGRPIAPAGVFRRMEGGRLLLFPWATNEPVSAFRLQTLAPRPLPLAELRVGAPVSLPPHAAPRTEAPAPAAPFALELAWSDAWPAPARTELALLDKDGRPLQALLHDATGSNTSR